MKKGHNRNDPREMRKKRRKKREKQLKGAEPQSTTRSNVPTLMVCEQPTNASRRRD